MTSIHADRSRLRSAPERESHEEGLGHCSVRSFEHDGKIRMRSMGISHSFNMAGHCRLRGFLSRSFERSSRECDPFVLADILLLEGNGTRRIPAGSEFIRLPGPKKRETAFAVQAIKARLQ